MSGVERTIDVIYTVVDEVKEYIKDISDWVHFAGSRESIALPKGQYAVGDNVKISFEKVTGKPSSDAITSRPPV